MKNFFLITALGILGVVIFDTIGATAAVMYGFDYQSIFIGSFLIYGLVGLAASKYHGLIFAPIAGGIAGYIDSTLGWYISWVITHGFTVINTDGGTMIATIVFVTITAAAIGFIGGVIEQVISRIDRRFSY